MISGLEGDLGKIDSPLEDLGVLISGRNTADDLVDEDVAAAVICAIASGVTWGAIAEALREERRAHQPDLDPRRANG